MSDVIDDELMKELGLDDDDLKVIENKKTTPRVSPSATAQTSVGHKTESGMESFKKSPPSVSVPVPPSPQITQPKAKPETPSFAEQTASLSKDLPVQLAVVLAKKSLSLGQVLEMRVGEVMELSRQPSDPIDLVANGKLVAKAELVMVDGQVGVRILKLMK